jgi:NitT/TauT family transport system ATP-binding protein
VASNGTFHQQAPVAVELRGVQKVFPNGTRALDAIDLTVFEGELVTLLGPSGCGKSTLLRLVAGLVPPTEGYVRLSSACASEIGFVFQNPTLMPWATVERNVRLPFDLQGRRGAAEDTGVRHALELVGLREFSHAYPRELSGGMQMRVSIARALVTAPKLLLMDEPFGALDEITRTRLDHDLSQLCARQNLTVLFVTHSIYEATFLSSRVLVMSARPGRVFSETHIDDPMPRNEVFRSSEQFMQRSVKLSSTLAAAAAESPA